MDFLQDEEEQIHTEGRKKRIFKVSVFVLPSYPGDQINCYPKT